MKTLHILIIFVFISIAIFYTNLSEVHAVSGSAYFMKSNSTAKIYADFTIHTLSNQSFDIHPEILTSLDDLSTKPSGLTIDSKPSSFIENMYHMHATYTITAKSNVKGVYPLFLFFCGTSPLVVGLNESEVNPVIYNKFFTAAYSCPAISTDTPDMNIIGYSGIISKTLSIDSNNTITVTSVSTLGPPLPTPLKQFKSGIVSQDVKCKKNLILVTKTENGSPACVKLTSIQKLVLLHWALKPINELTVEEFKDPYKASEKIDFVMKFKGFHACGYPSAIVKNAENKTIWESPIELTLCDPDTGFGEYKWRFGELYNVILNKTGSYRVDISFSDKKLEKEFEIK